MEFNSSNRTATTPRQAVNPQAHSDASQASMPMAPHKKNRKKSTLKLIVGAVITIAVLLAGWFAFSLLLNSARIDSGKYQAVFLTNGQVYFGKLSDSMGAYMHLRDVYYVQAKAGAAGADGTQQASEGQANVELVKLGNEVHGPIDEMTIRKEQVLFFENLKTDGQVAKTIAEYKK